MPEPSYDFFATGRPGETPEAGVPPIPGAHAQSPPAGHQFGTAAAHPTNQFGTPIAPSAPQPPAFPVAPGSGYDPGAVNQFGTPLDVVAAPTGPFAAPGVSAAPIDAPGMVSTWGGPAQHSSASRASRTAAPSDERPGTVLAAGVLSIITGVWGLLSGVLGLAALSAFSAQLAAAGDGLDVPVVTIVRAILLVTVVLGVVWLALGIGAVRGSRTSMKWLRIVVVIGALLALYSLVTQPGAVSLIDVVWHGVLLWLLYGQSTTVWMRRA